ncbi:MAG: hypothetical protein V1743_02985 [Nanoarchaeota archaeon]
MNQVSLLLLDELRKDSRKPFSKISREQKIPVTTLFSHYEKLKSEIISKHTSLVDFKKLGYPVRAMVFLQAADQEMLLKFLALHQNVNAVFRLEGISCCADVVFQTINEYHEFLEELDRFSLVSKESYDIIEQLMHEGFSIKRQPLRKII